MKYNIPVNTYINRYNNKAGSEWITTTKEVTYTKEDIRSETDLYIIFNMGT